MSSCYWFNDILTYLFVVDGIIGINLWALAQLTFGMLPKLGAIVLLSPPFIFPGILVALIGGWCGQLYIRAQLSVMREMSNAKAPVLGQ
jgi:hypothetical protein